MSLTVSRNVCSSDIKISFLVFVQFMFDLSRILEARRLDFEKISGSLLHSDI